MRLTRMCNDKQNEGAQEKVQHFSVDPMMFFSHTHSLLVSSRPKMHFDRKGKTWGEINGVWPTLIHSQLLSVSCKTEQSFVKTIKHKRKWLGAGGYTGQKPWRALWPWT